MLLYVGAAALLIPSCHAGRIRKSKEPAVLAEATEGIISDRKLLNTDGHEMPSECGETYECLENCPKCTFTSLTEGFCKSGNRVHPCFVASQGGMYGLADTGDELGDENGIVVDCGTVIDILADAPSGANSTAIEPSDEPIYPDPVFRPGSELDYAAPEGASGNGTNATAGASSVAPGEVPSPTTRGENSGGSSPTPARPAAPDSPANEDESSSPAPGSIVSSQPPSTATGPSADDDNDAFKPDHADPGATENGKNASTSAPGPAGSRGSRAINLGNESGDQVDMERNSWMWVIILLAVISVVFLCCCVFGRRFCMGRGNSE